MFSSMYIIRIPHIPNRMAFIYVVHFHVHTYSVYSQPYGFLCMLFISMYIIRIPHIPNRMAFMYAVHPCTYVFLIFPTVWLFMYAAHFHVHNTYSVYSQPYGFYVCCSFPCTYVFLVFPTVLVFADGRSSLRRCGTAEICGIAMRAEDTADSILLQTRGARIAFMCQRTKV
jgi:hypothetical protein